MKKKVQEKSVWSVLCDVWRLLLQGMVALYMVLILGVMPFYYTQGYGRIGTNKYEFFKMVSENLGKAFVPALGLYLVFSLVLYVKEKKWDEVIFRKLSVTDLFVLGYGLVVLVSYCFSDYKELTAYGDAWQGAFGWYMGTQSQLTFVVSYFAISRLWSGKRWLPGIILPVSFVVFGLGYLNRFDIRPIHMEYANPSFISTIGNMNWYCGYVVMIVSGLVGYYYMCQEENRWLKFSLQSLLLIGFGTLVTQGSLSGILVLFVMIIVLYLLSMKERERMERFLRICILLGSACTATVLVRVFSPWKISFTDSVIDLITYSPLPVVLLTMVIVWYLWLKRGTGAYLEKLMVTLGYGAVGLTAFCMVSFVVLLIFNTLCPGKIGTLSSVKVLTFSPGWASNRGATFMAGVRCFAEQDLLHKLIGVGPDSMAMYLYTHGSEGLLAMVRDAFGKSTLTNAHSELLTNLVNLGLLGAFFYVGMFATAICRRIKNGLFGNAMAMTSGLALLAYLMNNTFSFQQAMNGATVFVLLGMGENLFISQKKCDTM